jgi:Patatin-like phospholipase
MQTPPTLRSALDKHLPTAELAPAIRPKPQLPEAPYELALTSAGAVSAGAYIAGAMDFLFEALDAWHDAKRITPDTVPSHKVVLQALTGASAGAISAALVAVMRSARFRHLPSDPGPQSPVGNPLFDAWVNEIDIAPLLDQSDLAATDANGQTQPPAAFMNGAVLDAIAARAIANAASLPTIERPYLANPLRVILTQTNCRGVPYFVRFAESDAGQGMLQHGDQARFAIECPGGLPNHPAFADETFLRGAPAAASGWGALADAAVSSAAFPLGLPPRQRVGRVGDYDYRLYFPDPSSPDHVLTVKPGGAGWPPADADAQGRFDYVGVDGGVIDNDPFGVAHALLAGGLGRNPPEGRQACRTVIMIDPFPAAPTYGPAHTEGLGLSKLAGSLVGLLIAQARFKPRDLMLAHLEDVYSRFIIAPKRDQPVNGMHSLACGFLGGFGGFLSRRQRLHDFMLGRRNCQRFLSAHLCLPRDNPLFDGWRDAPWAKAYDIVGQDGSLFLPIIPLLRDAQGQPLIPEQEEPLWPSDAVATDAIITMVMARLKAIAKIFVRSLGFWPRLAVKAGLDLFVWRATERTLTAKLRAAKAAWRL